MDGIALVLEARAAGLVVLAEGKKLVVRGPKSAGAVALRLLENKVDVMRALGSAMDVPRSASPNDKGPQRAAPLAEACAACGSALGWRDAAGAVICAECLPEPVGGERVVLVNLAGRNEWHNYADERREHERRRVQLEKPLGGEPARRAVDLTADDIDRANDALDEAAADERLDDELPE